MKNLAYINNSMEQENMSNLTSASGDQTTTTLSNSSSYNGSFPDHNPAPPLKRKRNQPGHPDPEAEVIAMSPRSLLATNRFVCEICNKGFQRDQNLQLHRRGHNLPWKLKTRSNKDAVIRKKVYVCPERGCVHHDPSRALGDLTGIKKHFCRKHGEKKWKCDKCSKKYAVQSDWKAHVKTCGTKEYRCDCGTLFSRRDSFITHRAFCDALAEESAKSIATTTTTTSHIPQPHDHQASDHLAHAQYTTSPSFQINLQALQSHNPFNLIKREPQLDQHQYQNFNMINMMRPSWLNYQQSPTNNGPTNSNLLAYSPPPPAPAHFSATALLQKAASIGAKTSTTGHVPAAPLQFVNNLSCYGNKAAAIMTGGGGSSSTDNAGALVGDSNQYPSSTHASLLLHEMMMMNNSTHSAATTSFDHQNVGNFHASLGQFSTGNVGGRGDNHEDEDGMMTRDFLGLRPLSQSDIFSITTNCNIMSSSNVGGGGNAQSGNNGNEGQDGQSHEKSWQV